MEFAHCFTCGNWPRLNQDQSRRYFMSQCGRLFCFNCVARTSGRCSCETGCKLMEMNAEASPELRAMFTDVGTLLKNFKDSMDSIKKWLQIINFQRNVQQDALRICRQLYDASKSLRSEVTALKAEATNLRNENDTLKREREGLMKQMEDLQREKDALVKQLNANPISPITTTSTPTEGNNSLGFFKPPPQPQPAARPNVLVQPFFAESPSPPLFQTNREPSFPESQVINTTGTPRSTPNSFFNASHRNDFGNYRIGSVPSTSSPASSVMSGRSGRTEETSSPHFGRIRTPSSTPTHITERLRNLRCANANSGGTRLSR